MEGTTANNIAIAQFMGLISDNCALNYYLDDPDNEDIAYDCDWGVLMMVVEQIECLDTLHSVTFNINADTIAINVQAGFQGGQNVFTEPVVEGKLSAVYNACLQFINWYNEYV